MANGLKTGRHGISQMLVLFRIFDTKSIFGQIWVKNIKKLFVLPENLHTEYLEEADSYADISFLNFSP